MSYVYKVTINKPDHPWHGRYYIGSTVKSINTPYYGSGNNIRQFIDEFEGDKHLQYLDKEILAAVLTVKEARDLEQHEINKQWDPDLILNIHRGTNPGNTGQPFSPETKANMSAAKLGKKRSPETCAKMSAAMTGKKHTPETKAKIGAAHRGMKRSTEARANMSAGKMGNQNALGKKKSPEQRAKQSAAMKGRPLSPSHRANLSAAKKGKPQPRAVCQDCGEEGPASHMGKLHHKKCKGRQDIEANGQKRK